MSGTWAVTNTSRLPARYSSVVIGGESSHSSTNSFLGVPSATAGKKASGCLTLSLAHVKGNRANDSIMEDFGCDYLQSEASICQNDAVSAAEASQHSSRVETSDVWSQMLRELHVVQRASLQRPNSTHIQQLLNSTHTQ